MKKKAGKFIPHEQHAMAKLTPKQRIFVEVYCGNATDAARQAGYKNPRSQGHENLTKPDIRAALDLRDAEGREKRILTREERQRFWSDVVVGKISETPTTDNEGNDVCKPATLRDRLRASELLGKSQADFIERVKHSGEFTIGQIVADIQADTSKPGITPPGEDA